MRWAAVLLLALALAPGLWWRTAPQAGLERAPITITPLAVRAGLAGPLVLEGAWVLDSARPRFGGYSALIGDGPGRLLAASDGGQMLVIDLVDGRPITARLDPFVQRGGIENKRAFDVEALTRDPAGGAIWIASERSNAIQRFDAALRPGPRAAPAAMADWRTNGGPEAMTWLGDGRFVVLEEGAASWFGEGHRGLLFIGDPTDTATPAPIQFRFLPPDGFSPVDMAELPDGRVLLLLRRITWPLPPAFESALALADPAQISPGGAWRASLLPWDQAWPSENYEGLAVAPHPSGGLRLWLIADDNEMQHWQRTLLLSLHWAPGQAKGARSPAARP